MRITSFMIHTQQTRSIQRTMENMMKLGNQLSSGKKAERPSDDVIGTVQAMDYSLLINNNDQYKRNINNAIINLEFADLVFSSVSDTLSELKDSALAGLTAENRPDMADDVALLRDQLLYFGNSRFEDRYVFSGFRTDIESFDPVTYDYQGDSGIINVQIGREDSLPINVLGSDAFSYTLTEEEVIQLDDGTYIHYIPGPGTTVDVEIRDTDDTTVLDSFSYSNFIQVADLLSTALESDNVLRIQALLKPLDEASEKALDIQADTGMRLKRLDDQTGWINENTTDLKNLFSDTVDADPTETSIRILMTEVALEALMESSVRVTSLSLMDFLR